MPKRYIIEGCKVEFKEDGEIAYGIIIAVDTAQTTGDFFLIMKENGKFVSRKTNSCKMTKEDYDYIMENRLKLVEKINKFDLLDLEE